MIRKPEKPKGPIIRLKRKREVNATELQKQIMEKTLEHTQKVSEILEEMTARAQIQPQDAEARLVSEVINCIINQFPNSMVSAKAKKAAIKNRNHTMLISELYFRGIRLGKQIPKKKILTMVRKTIKQIEQLGMPYLRDTLAHFHKIDKHLTQARERFVTPLPETVEEFRVAGEINSMEPQQILESPAFEIYASVSNQIIEQMQRTELHR